MALPEAGQIRGPIVHLQIDVRVVVAAPWWCCGDIPDPLKVCRQASVAGRRDQQVTPELENEGLEPGIGPPFGVTYEALVGGQLRDLRRRFTKFQRHAVEQVPVIFLVRGQQLAERLLHGLVHQRGQSLVRMRPTPAFGMIGQIRGLGSKEDRQAVAFLERQRHRWNHGIEARIRLPAVRDTGIFRRLGLGRTETQVA